MHKVKKWFSLFCDVIEKILEVIVAVLLAYMTILAIVEVFRRYLFGLSWRWSEETIRFSLIWMSFCGAAIGYRKNNLVSMDIITSKLNGKSAGIILATVCRVLILGASLYVGYLGVVALGSPSVSSYIAPGSEMSMIIPYAAIPVGMFVIALYSIEKLIGTCAEFKAIKVKEEK